MGQCGQGNFNSPIRKPVKVINLEGVPIHQISAGTSHSIVWTAIPSNRYVLFIFEDHQISIYLTFGSCFFCSGTRLLKFGSGSTG